MAGLGGGMLPAPPCLLLSAWEDQPLARALAGHGTAHQGRRGSAKNRQGSLSSGVRGVWSPSRLCPDPPHAVSAPALVLGGGPALPPPSPSLHCTEMQSHCSFLCPASFSLGREHSLWRMDGRTDGQTGVLELGWGWQPTCGGVDAPEVEEQHCRVREVEGHLEERPRKGQS